MNTLREMSVRSHPASLIESLRDVPLVCPLCRGTLGASDEAYHCKPCERTYPLQHGIPDFRVAPDPYLSFEEDRQRAEKVVPALPSRDFEALLEYYWSLSDVTPPLLRARFVRSGMLGEQRASRVLRVLAGANQTAGRAKGVLEIGSGTGNFLVAAVTQYPQVVGTDVAMRWLHISRRRFMERGLPTPPLVCCCAESLPFPDGMFDLTVCCATLEFCREPDRVLAEAARCLLPSGAMYISTVNRFSIAQNPYAGLWGVGFLPQSWQAPYVRWRRQASYENVRLLSLRQLKALAGRHFAGAVITLPVLDDEALRGLPWTTRLQGNAYRLARKLPIFDRAFRWIVPQWDVLLDKPRSAGLPALRVVSSSLKGPAEPPLVSVIIPCVNGLPGIGDCLQCLIDQEGAQPLDIVVVDRCGESTRAVIRSRFPQVSILAVNGSASIPAMRALGIAHAKGDKVAIIEDHCMAQRGWLRAIERAHRAGYQAVGGTVENGNQERLVDQAVFLCEYAPFMSPVASGRVQAIPGNNAAYDRALFEQLQPELRGEFWESFWHDRMKELGVEFYSDPEMVIVHDKHFGYCYFLRQRYLYSRSFAGARLKGSPWWKKVAYTCATPLLPPLLLGRLAATVARKRHHAKQFICSLPLLLTFVVAWAIGEGAGAVLGPGHSLEHVE
jgi:SAM-dependent methyltransferase/glycosyltransferase involved in cell wall biosynthesis